ncbi:hypothetical protein LSH36_189g01030 [Paralvinella palmiformis]|uniref:Uncharacterized protein n=1 Tax=Paralvinella palmiformis TaxID=53620 RepID=A0AAD9N816_9ANNE|nr:hypothetical protein LSH36_189g01030 [Paralvinella palmiformis]
MYYVICMVKSLPLTLLELVKYLEIQMMIVYIYLDIMIVLAQTRDDKREGEVGLFVKDNINYKMGEDLSVFIPSYLSKQNYTKGKSNEIIGVIYKTNIQPKACNLDIFI